MAYASALLPAPTISIPRHLWTRLRWPRLSQRTRALLMLGAMVSPTVLADPIGYGVKRLFLTPDQIAAKQVPDETVMRQLSIFHVACIDPDLPAAERQHWADVAAQRGWPRFPEGGPACFRPDRVLYGIAGLKAFNVACPAVALSPLDERRWVAFAANHGWTDYSQAGAGCVDP